MARAFVFPGQGSQSVGMGKEIADAYPDAKAVFDEVDEALGEKLSDIIWNGPEETLTLTANAQPALMAVSLATLKAMESEGFKVTQAHYVAGHSLGCDQHDVQFDRKTWTGWSLPQRLRTLRIPKGCQRRTDGQSIIERCLTTSSTCGCVQQRKAGERKRPKAALQFWHQEPTARFEVVH